MLIERIQSVQPSCERSSTANLYHDEKFRDVFERSLNSRSHSRPPKLELSGLLISCHRLMKGELFKFKLETKDDEYLLRLSPKLFAVAQKIEWEEVTVKGTLDLDSNILEVEKITLAKSSEPVRAAINLDDGYLPADDLIRTISQLGKLEPAVGYMAS